MCLQAKVPLSSHHDWAKLRADIAQYGVRNSLLVAPMPTASTSQILGNNECFEPYTSNIYTRRVLSGEFTMVNRHLVSKLMELGLWSAELKQELIANNGSVQKVDSIPPYVKEVGHTSGFASLTSVGAGLQDGLGNQAEELD